MSMNQVFAALKVHRGPWVGLGTAAVLIALANPIAVVPAGHRGVLTTFGRVTPEPLGEGLHFRIPLAQDVELMNVQVQKGEGGDSAASRDLQHVNVKVALNYRIEPAQTAALYRDIGTVEVIGQRIIEPAVHEAVKATVARFTAEELVTRRTEVRQIIREQLEARLRSRGVVVEDFAITAFSFSKEFEAAIEAKSRAEQERMKAERDLERIRVEAEQQLTRARAETEALALQRTQITPELLQWKALERWDGKLPEVVAGDTPALQIPLRLPQTPAR
jgi:prohibitin 2